MLGVATAEASVHVEVEVEGGLSWASSRKVGDGEGGVFVEVLRLDETLEQVPAHGECLMGSDRGNLGREDDRQWARKGILSSSGGHAAPRVPSTKHLNGSSIQVASSGRGDERRGGKSRKWYTDGIS